METTIVYWRIHWVWGRIGFGSLDRDVWWGSLTGGLRNRGFGLWIRLLGFRVYKGLGFRRV